MNDLQTLLVTLFLGGITYWVVRYLARIFSKAATSNSASVAASSDNGNANQKKRKITPEQIEAKPERKDSDDAKVTPNEINFTIIVYFYTVTIRKLKLSGF
jgi:hypothetical protein